MSTPEIIYLIKGETDGGSGMVWCDCAAPDQYCNPDEAVKYVRADTLPLPVLPPRPPTGAGMPRYGLQWNGPTKPLSAPMDDGYWTPWHLASAANERLQARVAELESDDAVMCLAGLMEGLEIPPGTMFKDPVSLNMLGKAIAAQAKEADKAGGDK